MRDATGRIALRDGCTTKGLVTPANLQRASVRIAIRALMCLLLVFSGAPQSTACTAVHSVRCGQPRHSPQAIPIVWVATWRPVADFVAVHALRFLWFCGESGPGAGGALHGGPLRRAARHPPLHRRRPLRRHAAVRWRLPTPYARRRRWRVATVAGYHEDGVVIVTICKDKPPIRRGASWHDDDDDDIVVVMCLASSFCVLRLRRRTFQ